VARLNLVAGQMEQQWTKGTIPVNCSFFYGLSGDD
jgi:hypothetical protein